MKLLNMADYLVAGGTIAYGVFLGYTEGVTFGSTAFVAGGVLGLGIAKLNPAKYVQELVRRKISKTSVGSRFPGVSTGTLATSDPAIARASEVKQDSASLEGARQTSSKAEVSGYAVLVTPGPYRYY